MYLSDLQSNKAVRGTSFHPAFFSLCIVIVAQRAPLPALSRFLCYGYCAAHYPPPPHNRANVSEWDLLGPQLLFEWELLECNRYLIYVVFPESTKARRKVCFGVADTARYHEETVFEQGAGTDKQTACG